MIWIAVDAMGGDEAPRNIVEGALAAARHFDLGVLLVGQARAIESELLKYSRPLRGSWFNFRSPGV